MFSKDSPVGFLRINGNVGNQCFSTRPSASTADSRPGPARLTDCETFISRDGNGPPGWAIPVTEYRGKEMCTFQNPLFPP